MLALWAIGGPHTTATMTGEVVLALAESKDGDRLLFLPERRSQLRSFHPH
jgi:hypothetical protein